MDNSGDAAVDGKFATKAQSTGVAARSAENRVMTARYVVNNQPDIQPVRVRNIALGAIRKHDVYSSWATADFNQRGGKRFCQPHTAIERGTSS